jgi:hypothetical protein
MAQKGPVSWNEVFNGRESTCSHLHILSCLVPGVYFKYKRGSWSGKNPLYGPLSRPPVFTAWPFGRHPSF